MSVQVQAKAVLTLRNNTCGLKSLLIGERVAWQHPPGAQRLEPQGHVLFVHGFNNSHEQARKSYARFRGGLGKFNANARVLELHWPGDGIKHISENALAYPAQIPRAIKCGKLLAHWIEGQTFGANFILVGHSLGCRLILEALKELDQRHLHRITGVCLMAAAVPVRKIKRNELGPVHTEWTDWRILYSRGDTVLGAVFHFGQILDSVFTRAVGYLGEPANQWNQVGTREEMYDLWNEKEYYYEHGWYWPGGRVEGTSSGRAGESTPLPPIQTPKTNDGRSAMAVAEMLGIIMDRTLKRRCQPQGRAIASEREFWCRPIGEA